MDIVKKGFIAEGTTCASCAEVIKRQARKVKGVKDVSFDYSTETGYVSFDKEKTDIDTILYQIEEKGYTCFILDNVPKNNETAKIFGWVFSIIGLIVVGYFLFTFVEGIQLPELSQNMGYGLLFLVGLLTGFHCIGMCGGFVISYTAKDAKERRKSHKSHIMYGAGKTISYTLIGAAFGLLGSIIAFTPMMRGVAGVLAGIFLVVFGLNMLVVIPWLRNIRIRTPLFISKMIGKESSKHSSPLIIGLFNGLMIACGPLQAMYIMAAGTGSMVEGAKLLLIFGIGTLPAMLGFGYVASIVSKKATHNILKASGAIVIILGLVMVNRGLALTGTGFDTNSIIASVSASGNEITGNSIAMQDGYQIIRMEVNRYGWEPDKFVLKKDVPVKWIIDGKEINGCNNAIQVPKLGLNFDIRRGEQTIEFTPDKEGTISWSCWMGMIPGLFIVKDDVDLNNAAEIQKEIDAAPELQGGSCGGSGGGCGCGG